MQSSHRPATEVRDGRREHGGCPAFSSRRMNSRLRRAPARTESHELDSDLPPAEPLWQAVCCCSRASAAPAMVAAASGTALALLDQQETLRSWWNALPGYIDDVQKLLGQVQGAVEAFDVQREKLHQVLSR